jgi:hypothetical protein
MTNFDDKIQLQTLFNIGGTLYEYVHDERDVMWVTKAAKEQREDKVATAIIKAH